MKVIATRPEPQLAARGAPAPAPAFVALVVAAQGGDRAAFARLYDQFEPTVRGIALARVSPGDARDVLHDVFVTVLTRLPSLRAPLALVNVSFTIEKDGKVTAATAGPTSADYPGLAGCVATEVRGWSFGPADGAVSARLPFVFTEG